MEEVSSNGSENKAGKKSALMFGVAAVGILIVAGAIFMMNGSGEEKGETMGIGGDDEEEQTSSNLDEKMSFQDLLGGEKSQKCVFSTESDGSKSEGTFYTSSGKGRAMISNTVLSAGNAGMTTTSNMIFDTESNMMYLWDTVTKQGMKMAMNQGQDMESSSTMTAEDDAVATPSDEGGFAKEFNQEYSYDCDSWKVDESMFVLPSDVTFTDLANMMKALPTPTAPSTKTSPGAPSVGEAASSLPDEKDMKALQCSACEQAGDQKETCKKSLGCE